MFTFESVVVKTVLISQFDNGWAMKIEKTPDEYQFTLDCGIIDLIC